MNLQYEQFLYVYYIAMGLAILFFVIAVILFFALKIPAVIGDLSGATARKAIENIRTQNEATGDKEHASSPVNRERGRLTDKISPSGSLHRSETSKLFGMRTEKISTQKLAENETTVLYTGGAETTVLGGGETTVLGGGETTVLNMGGGAGETTLLSDMPAMAETGRLAPSINPNIFFEIEYEITFIHSQEIIA